MNIPGRRQRTVASPGAACLISLLALAIVSSTPRAEARESVPLNENWAFAFASDAGDPAAFRPVTLPHTWNADDTADKTRPYRQTEGVYRRKFVPPASLEGKTLYLYFEGANQVADVYVNGEPAGSHIGGYTAFAIDVTDRVRPGRANDIEVRVDNRHDETIPPLNADFTFYGGLYRDVRLLALDEAHFALDEFAATAVRIDTPEVSAAHAVVRIETAMRNTASSAKSAVVTARIVDADGNEVGRAATETALAPDELTSAVLVDIVLDSPALWSPESPYLYTAVVTLSEDGRVLDEVRYPLGLRWFDADPVRGFVLNGKPYPLRGTNRHQDQAGYGNAVPDFLQRQDLARIKADGFNFLRLAHYPQDPSVLAAADELGLIVWEEIPVVNIIGLAPAFGDNAERLLREMIRQHRQHPSIAFWGYMNEVTLRLPEPMPDGYLDSVVTLATRLEQATKSEDGSRLSVMALSRDELEHSPAELQSLTDVLAFNLYFGWYYEDFPALGGFLDDYREKHPGRPLMVSEYGAGSDARVHALEAEAFDFSVEYQQAFHEAAFEQILNRPWLVGSAVWNHFDFGSNHRQDTMFGINQKGLWTYDRTPKDVASYYRAHLANKPVVHIATREWPQRAGSRPGDARMPVKVYTNAGSVELFLNGRSQSSRRVHNATATWDVRLEPGTNRLVARTDSGSDEARIHYDDRSSLFDKPAANSTGPVAIAVNAGGHEQIVGGDGTVWEADRAYGGSGWGYVGGETERTHHRIFGTSLDPLYQTRRTGPHEYRFDIPDGDWCATLHETDYESFEAGTRRIDLAARAGDGLRVSFAAGDAVSGIALARGTCAALDDVGLTHEGSATLMTFNIRTASAQDGANDWEHRAQAVVETVLAHEPDIVGFQEAEPGQVAYLAENLRAYAWVGRSREADVRIGEAVPLFFHSGRWRLDAAETGTFWLSDRPAEPGSRSWGNHYPRIATWARLVRSESGQGLYVYNLHLDHESEPARLASATLVSAHAAARAHDDPVIVLGDFNAPPDSGVLRIVLNDLDLQDGYAGHTTDSADAGTYHAFTGDAAGHRIDFILVPDDMKVVEAGIDRRHTGGRYPSDHFPVTTVIEF